MGFATFMSRAGVYLAAFVVSFFALGALDFNRFLKQGKLLQGQVLYWVLALGLAYLSGSFVISLIYLP